MWTFTIEMILSVLGVSNQSGIANVWNANVRSKVAEEKRKEEAAGEGNFYRRVRHARV